MLRLKPWLLAALLACLAAAPQAQTAPSGKGIAVAIGGALKLDNDAVWQRLVELSGGKGARWVVLATAAGNPGKSGDTLVEVLQKHGAVAEALPIAPRLAGSDYRAAARDPALVAKVLAARGVYFSGGAQERITQALLDEKGQPTPVLAAIWQIYRAGGVVAGSSAGAAIMSTHMFRDAQDVLEVMKGGMTEGRQIDRGLGFVGPDIFVDQHFLKRGRFGRMLPLMLAKGYQLGVGVDENTAVIFQGDSLEVIGYKGALIADLGQASSDPRLPAFNLRNARLSYLDRGDRYRLSTRTATPSKEKLADLKVDPNAAGFKPYFTRDAFYADALGDTTVANLMGNLIDNAQREVTALAFGGPGSARPELGFEFRFRKGADSIGYYTGAFGGEDYSVFNIYLDVTPITLSQPLYRPLQATKP
ncbi:MAG: cyanophycinase [Burkholderiaceae bacterium]|nr:cyanophycinase [Burkholderiaceae bacterium]